MRAAFEEDFDAFTRAEEGDGANGPGADGRRAIGDAAHAGDAVRDADDPLGGEAARGHVLLQAGRDGDEAIGPVDCVPLDERVQRVDQPSCRVAAGRTVDVVDERHACFAGRQSADERRARRVSMDELIVVVADQPGELLDDAKIESAGHGHFHQWCALRFSRRGEQHGADAGEANLVAELRHLAGEQILNALGAGIVLAVDDVQDTARFRSSTVRR